MKNFLIKLLKFIQVKNRTVKLHSMATIFRTLHNLISTVLNIVHLVGLNFVDCTDDESCNRERRHEWINWVLFSIGIACKIPNLIITITLKIRATKIYEEYYIIHYKSNIAIPTQYEKF